MLPTHTHVPLKPGDVYCQNIQNECGGNLILGILAEARQRQASTLSLYL